MTEKGEYALGQLAVALESDPIAGQVSADGTSRPFRGWLELFAAVEELHSDGTLAPRSQDPSLISEDAG